MLNIQKNYLLFIIDSLNYSHVKNSTIELMPFLQELKSQGIFCDNMYSQAPYTEAAVMGLYCGVDVLQNNGYLFRFKDAKTTLFEEMKKAGYITYYNSYQPQCHPSSVRRGVDYLYYNVGYDLGALWSYRLKHYSDQFKTGNLNSEDIKVLKEIFEDNFKEWIRFVNDIINKHESTNMIIDNAPDYKPTEVMKCVSEEYLEYKKNPETYIISVLGTGQKHSLFRIPAYIQNRKIQNRKMVTVIKNEMLPLFRRIETMNFKLNLKNCRGLMNGPIKKFGMFLRHPCKASFKEFLKSSYLVVNELKDMDLFQRIYDDCDWFKNAPSGRTHIDHYLRWAEQHKNDGAHFACIHIDDIHNPEVFFTYDTEDMNLIRKEKKYAEEILDKIPNSYYGSLTHDLSLRYIDSVIKYLYDELDKRGMKENLCIAICADHGFSFSGNPLRDSFVINLFLENYNIPCVVTGSGLEHKVVNGLRMSKDIPATLCELAFGKVPNGFSGHSLMEDFIYPKVQIEYCGGGCPDLTRRELKLAAFDNSYFVGTLSTLEDVLTSNKITEVYDLIKDPLQLNNLCNTLYNSDKVKDLLNYIEVRRNEIKRTMK